MRQGILRFHPPQPSLRAWACCLAMVWLNGGGQAEAASLGRLFYTPLERKALDEGRALSAQGDAPQVQESYRLRLDGYVDRKGSRATVWLNGQPVPIGSRFDQVQPTRIDAARRAVGLQWYKQSVSIQPGQVAELPLSSEQVAK
ncbi:hypothetical protein HNQ59_002775 [Chitinivorax tropicus]|uniref:Uncharacterized protein n=1 Tax=Chitinivorax tropicus TaxID=714531 RepID=A0A840MT76_9PROT|nr:hypothetical protein [Chitinivorax tropicus]MBB5019473.1 hypothetical protein [Chitinivorax tropicus]